MVVVALAMGCPSATHDAEDPISGVVEGATSEAEQVAATAMLIIIDEMRKEHPGIEIVGFMPYEAGTLPEFEVPEASIFYGRFANGLSLDLPEGVRTTTLDASPPGSR